MVRSLSRSMSGTVSLSPDTVTSSTMCATAGPGLLFLGDSTEHVALSKSHTKRASFLCFGERELGPVSTEAEPRLRKFSDADTLVTKLTTTCIAQQTEALGPLTVTRQCTVQQGCSEAYGNWPRTISIIKHQHRKKPEPCFWSGVTFLCSKKKKTGH